VVTGLASYGYAAPTIGRGNFTVLLAHKRPIVGATQRCRQRGLRRWSPRLGL